jgi:hypothetical protein
MRLPSQHCGLWPVVLSPDESECDQVSKRDRLGLTPNRTTRELWRSRRWTKEMKIWSFRSFGTSRVILHAVKSYDMGPSRFTSHPSGRCAEDFYRLKNPSPWPDSKPQPLGPVASTLTTTPPRRLRRRGERRYSSYTFMTLALDGDSDHAPAALYPRGKDPRYP